jgi:FkbM family methyltransferase
VAPPCVAAGQYRHEVKTMTAPRGPFKRQTFDILRSRQIPVRTVLDVGVLTGTPELLEAYPDRMHVLFEPVAEFAATIEQVYRNTPHRLVQAAVSDTSGETHLSTKTIMAGLGISHSYMTDAAEPSLRTVPKVCLDDYLRQNPVEPPYLLKIDIDGFEMKVLHGATEALKQSSIVIIEVTVYDLVERIGYLQQAGFRLFDISEPCYYDQSLWQGDAVMIRNDVHSRHFETLDMNFDETKYQIFRA